MNALVLLLLLLLLLCQLLLLLLLCRLLLLLLLPCQLLLLLLLDVFFRFNTTCFPNFCRNPHAILMQAEKRVREVCFKILTTD